MSTLDSYGSGMMWLHFKVLSPAWTSHVGIIYLHHRSDVMVMLLWFTQMDYLTSKRVSWPVGAGPPFLNNKLLIWVVGPELIAWNLWKPSWKLQIWVSMMFYKVISVGWFHRAHPSQPLLTTHATPHSATGSLSSCSRCPHLRNRFSARRMLSRQKGKKLIWRSLDWRF